MKTPILILLASIVTTFAQVAPPTAADPFAPAADVRNRRVTEPPSPLDRLCTIDLRNPGKMKDIVSNVLIRIEKRPESEVNAFLANATSAYQNGDALMLAAAAHFKIDQTKMATEVQKMRHVNCIHGAVFEDDFSDKTAGLLDKWRAANPPATERSTPKAKPAAAADPFVKGGTETQTLTGENTYSGEIRPTNYQVLFETFDVSREDFLALLDEKGDDDVRYRRVAEWMAAGRAKLTTFTALTTRSGQRSKVEAIDEVRYATEFGPPISADDIASPTTFEVKNAGESLELEVTVAEDLQSAAVNIAPSSVTLLSFVDELAEPDKANSATSQPRFGARSLVTIVTAQMNRPRLIGTLSGASDQGGIPAEVRVAFLTVRRANLPKPKPEALVKDATQARIEYTFFSLDRSAARDLCLAKPEPQACYDGLRALVGEKRARLEHLSMNVTRWGQQTRTAENQDVRYATDWTSKNPDVRPAIPVVGKEFEIKNTGFSSQVEPQLAEDGATADLLLALEFVRYAGNLQVTGIAKKYPPQPLFQTSKVTTPLYMTVGEQQLIGTFNTPAESGANGRKDDGRVWLGFVRAVLVK